MILRILKIMFLFVRHSSDASQVNEARDEPQALGSVCLFIRKHAPVKMNHVINTVGMKNDVGGERHHHYPPPPMMSPVFVSR